jgi:hypothetical protein
MGSIKKALKPVTKVVDDIIPNEIKPALPYIAATFGAPYLAPAFGSLGGAGIGGLALRKGLSSALINAGTRAAMGRKVDPVSAGISGLLAGGGELLSGMKAPFAQDLGKLISPGKVGEMGLGEVAKAATVPLTAGTAESARDAARKANEEYEQYLAEQEAAGNADIQTRADYISRYMGLAGFGQDEINETLNDLGYAANGGLMGTRVGYKIGGSTVSNFLAKFGVGRPDYDSLMTMFEERKKEIFNSMFDPEAGTGAYNMEQMQQADEMATKQATQELNEYMEKIGMDLMNPPEGSVSDDLINEIMKPREEGRVQEANGGRAGYKVGGNVLKLFTFDDGFDRGMFESMYDDYLEGSGGKGLYEYAMDWLGSAGSFGDNYKKGGRVNFAEGGSSTEQQKRENYFDLKRDEFMSLSEYLLSPMSDSDLRSGKAEGGIMSLQIGGMPAEMDLRPGGFVPIGAKEKADDVPARLSKNEFVMTADAVRAAGGGSVNKGAKRMYDLMNKLEARV